MRFDQVYICNNRIPSDQVLGASDVSLKCNEFNGEWIKGKSAGGCLMRKDFFFRNPQFTITLDTPDKNDPEGKCSLFLSLTQKNRRSRNGNRNYITLGYCIYKLEPNQLKQVPMGELFFRLTNPVEYTTSFINNRGITGRHKFPPGSYLIIPSSFDTESEAEFLLRVYYDTPKKDTPVETDDKADEPEGINLDLEIHDNKKDIIKRDDMGGADIITSDESEEIDHPEWDDVEKMFKNAAGKNEAIDWMELKKILDSTIPQGKKMIFKIFVRN